MRTKLLLWIFALFAVCALQAKEVNDRYIEVTGTSEIEIVPDKIHYLIEIREYFEEGSILKRSSTVSPSRKDTVRKYLWSR